MVDKGGYIIEEIKGLEVWVSENLVCIFNVIN